MLKYFIFLNLFGHLQADELNDTMKLYSVIVQEMNKSGKIEKPCLKQIELSELETKNKEQALKCINSLCPSDNRSAKEGINPYQLASINEQNKKRATDKINKLGPQIDKTIEDFIHHKKIALEKLKAKQNDPNFHPDLTSCASKLFDDVNIFRFENDISTSFNESSFSYSKYNDDQKHLIDEYVSSSNIFLGNEKKNFSFSSKTPEKYENFINYAKTQIELLKKNGNKSAAEMLERNLKNTNIDDNYDLVKNLIIFKTLTTNPTLFNKTQTYCDDQFKKINFDQKLSSLGKEKLQIKNRLMGAIYFDASHACPKENLASIEKNVKKKIKEHIISRFSKKTQDVLNQFLDQTVHLELEAEALNQYEAQNSFDSLFKTMQNQNLTIDNQIRHNELEQFNLDSNDEQITENAERSLIITDGFDDRDKFGRIYTSTVSCANPKIGEKIISHEMGHSLNIFISKAMSKSKTDNQVVKNAKIEMKDYKKVVNLRECIQTNHPYTPAITNPELEDPINLAENYPNDLKRTEEDTADWISYACNKNDPNLFSCAMLIEVNDKDKPFLNIESQNYYIFNDYHSTSFFRLLQEANSKNKLTPICKKVVDENPSLIRLKKCEL